MIIRLQSKPVSLKPEWRESLITWTILRFPPFLYDLPYGRSFHTPPLVRRAPQHEVQLTATDDILVVDVTTVVRLAVQRGGLDVTGIGRIPSVVTTNLRPLA